MDGSTRVHPVGDGLMELNKTGSITGTTPPSEPNAPDDKSNKLEHNQSGTALDCSKQMKLLANERKEVIEDRLEVDVTVAHSQYCTVLLELCSLAQIAIIIIKLSS